MRNIVIIRFSSLGDIILTTPVVASIRKKYPRANITFVTKDNFSDALEENPDINEIITLGKKQSILSLAKKIRVTLTTIDLVIDLHSSMRSRLLKYFINVKEWRSFKKPYVRRFFLIYFKWNLLKTYPSVVERYALAADTLDILTQIRCTTIVPQKVESTGINFELPIFCIAPGATWFTKKWPIDYVREVIALLKIEFNNLQIVVVGGKAEQVDAQYLKDKLGNDSIIDYTGKLSIRETAFIISQSDVLLSNDSGLMHVASAFDISIVALFLGTSLDLGFKPYTSNAIIISKDLDCKPCNHKGLAQCPKKHFNCAHSITPKEVFQNIKFLLEKKVK